MQEHIETRGRLRCGRYRTIVKRHRDVRRKSEWYLQLVESRDSRKSRLHYVANSPVPGLALVERRVSQPRATIVCVHGGLDRGRSFRRLAQYTDEFDLVSYDRRGYQRSRALGPLSFAHHVDDLLAVAGREVENGSVIIFGHSYGGVISMGAAVQEPGLAELVVTYESPIPWVLYREGSQPPIGDTPAIEAENFFKRMTSEAAWDHLTIMEQESRQLDGPALVCDLQSLREGELFDVNSLLKGTICLHGDGMLGGYYHALCARLVEKNPNVRAIELAGVGHGAHLTNPQVLGALLRQLAQESDA